MQLRIKHDIERVPDGMTGAPRLIDGASPDTSRFSGSFTGVLSTDEPMILAANPTHAPAAHATILVTACFVTILVLAATARTARRVRVRWTESMVRG